MADRVEVAIVVVGEAKAVSDTKKVDKSVDKLGTTVKKTSAAFNGMAVAAAATAVAYAGLRVLKDVVQNAAAAESATAALEAVLKSTSEVAGVTKEAALALSNELQGLTAVSDDLITEGQALLLTFTSISKDVFPDAIKTALDMSRAFKTDLKGSVIQLGKALNDPIKGVGALAEVGVSFTQTQKDMIKVLQESGDIMDAQRIILDELKKEVGGAAEAYSKTLGGGIERAKLALDDFSQAIGEEIAPAIKGLTENTITLVENLTDIAPAIVAVTAEVLKFAATMAVIAGSLAIFKLGAGRVAIFGAAVETLSTKLAGVKLAFGTFVTSLTDFKAPTEALSQTAGGLDKVKAGFILVGRAVKAFATSTLGMIVIVAGLARVLSKLGTASRESQQSVLDLRDKFEEFSKIESPEALEEINKGLSELELIAKTLPNGIAAITLEADKLVETLSKKVQDTSFLTILKQELLGLILVGGSAQVIANDLNALAGALGLAAEARNKFNESQDIKDKATATTVAKELADLEKKIAKDLFDFDKELAEEEEALRTESDEAKLRSISLNDIALQEAHERNKQRNAEAFEALNALTAAQMVAVTTISSAFNTFGASMQNSLQKTGEEAVTMGEAMVTAFKSVAAEMSKVIAKNIVLLGLQAILSPGKFAANVATGTALATALLGGIDFTAAATGMNQQVTKPTLILAGEAGPEHVQITPLGRRNRGGKGAQQIIININGGLVDENFVRYRLNPIIQDVQTTG